MLWPPIDPANISERELDEAARRGERMLAWLESAQEELRAVTGTGSGPSGHVRVSVDADGRVLDVRYDGRALRLGSQDLAEETLAAVRAACADAERRTHDLMREAFPGYDPAATQAELERLLGEG
ncbi:YbaB/EbfC family nucleoid-associated protein [Actinomadura sp. ATCC 31491]|uniref:YbaB/EbfC family nucleoid-associated protein n=1 Tax=Actinomadura luzonensis TaxID=2805427 RepID=A0ABT0FWY1_9ACTN|nr:YbaB/EbfC family nucleoid-associated protein [Actinomadura luzonensis]MCK2216779.1 YbaB/EbfC family nucleoid-associated protein [Actinomadura luzonensis]